MKHVEIIIPCYNEMDILYVTHDILCKVTSRIKNIRFSFLFIDDGSTDNTRDVIRDIAARNDNVSFYFMSRNFGKEMALTCGLDHVTGDACIFIDADLQDPPDLIEIFCQEWLDHGYNAVYGQRLSRKGEGIFKKASAYLFYKIINSLSGVDQPANTGDFRLIDRQSIEEIKKLREQHRYMKGLLCWIGLKQKCIQYHREPRIGGHSKWGSLRLVHFAIDAITGYSLFPIRLISCLGILTAFIALCFAGYTVTKVLLFGIDVPGYASVITAISLFSGIQLFAIGIIGEYIGRIFNESKGRSLYVLQEAHTGKAH